MAKYPVSGTATQAVPANTGTGATGTTTVYSITSGRVFWCRGVSQPSATVDGVLELYDATTQSTATTHPIRLAVQRPLNATQSSLGSSVIQFSPPGIKFSNNYVLAKMAGTGTIALGSLSVWGYEE